MPQGVTDRAAHQPGAPSTVSTAAPSIGATVAAAALVAGCLAAALAGSWLALRAGEPVPWRSLGIPLIWSVPGALIAAARPRAALGWLNLGVAALFSLSGLAEAWLRSAGGDEVPLTAYAVWYVDRAAAAIVPVTTLALLLLPDSRLPSRRWRLPVAGSLVVQATLVMMWSLSATTAAAPDSTWSDDLTGLANPLAVLPRSAATVADDLVWLLQLPLLLAVAAMVARIRRTRGRERARLVAPLLSLIVFVAVILAGRTLWAPVADVVDVLACLLLAAVLVAAVLRRHLDGVTVVVHHAFVATVLGAAIAGAYAATIGVVAWWGPELSRIGAGVVAGGVALAVQPLRARLQRWVDRALHGDRKDPYTALSRLAEHAHRAPGIEEVLAGVTASVAASLRVPRVVAEAFGVRVEHPRGDLGASRVGEGSGARANLVAGDRTVGTLLVVPQAGRRLKDDEQRLLTELGRHAGLAVDSARLAADVAAHHRQLVTAREEERRRVGRELHDGLGPTVAGLSMQLGALRPLVRADPDTVVARLATLESAATAALADIRRVAHQLRPPVLDQVGFGPAVRQVAESLGLVVVEDVLHEGPLPAAVELAAYRIAAEAMANVARHAGVDAVRLQARETGGCLVLVVADDGRGVGDEPLAGLGLTTMRERAEELGGTLTVASGERGGTVVTAVLPLTASVSGVREVLR